MATLTREKRENLGPVICENIIAKILFCCAAKNSYHENFRVYDISSVATIWQKKTTVVSTIEIGILEIPNVTS